MLVAAAVVPTPPLLVPEVAGGSASREDDLRAACDEAVRSLLDAGPDRVVVVGSAPVDGPVTGEPDWRPYGVRGPVVDQPLPLALGIGAWLLARAGVTADALVGVRDGVDGAALVADGRVGLLVCGDGSARRDEKAPGHLDPRAAPFDASVAAALAGADPAALAALDPGLATELMAAGHRPWQVLATAADGAFTGRLLYDAAPYGVGWFVCHWRRA